ncbi:transglycosylase SLT domain-containing protein [Kozakia baliensis]|uniref:lytic transglycosylase domain-containing protein n=1 Tax=Kozakia baliensis TaxID=153496 RepID=UPI00345BC9C7
MGSPRTSKVRNLLALSLVGGLAACATNTPTRPQLPVSQEAATYRSHAKSYYAPPGSSEDPWGPYIEEASKRFDVPEPWIRAVMMQESGGRLFDRNGQFTTSVPGAMGLMQLMPPTYDDMREQYALGDDAYDPHDNIMAGTAYIRQMYDIYGSPGFLAAYNDGPGSVDSYLRRGRPLPRETRRYVASIGPQIIGIWPNSRSTADLMVAQHDPNAASPVMVAQNTAQARAVRDAWQHHAATMTANADDGQEDQVAEAPTVAQAAPASGSANSVSAAWAARGMTAQPAPIQLASARSSLPADNANETKSVRDVWATREPAQPIPVAHPLAAQPVMATMPRHSSFHLISPAMAEPLPTIRHAAPVATTPHNWAIQVGAYNSTTQASRAVGQAQTHARTYLASARSQIAPVQTGRAHLFRARLTGLSHNDAVAACQRMGRGTPCVVVSPGSSF